MAIALRASAKLINIQVSQILQIIVILIPWQDFDEEIKHYLCQADLV